MASTYSDLKIELIGTGDQTGTWGLTTNTNLGTAIEEAITGTADVSFSNNDVVITLTNTNTSQAARNLRLNLIGSIAAAQSLTVPAIKKFYVVNNTLAYNVTVKCAGGIDTGVIVPAGTATFLFNTSTAVVNAISYLTTLYLGIPLSVASGGTGSALATGAPFALKGANSDITSIGGLTTPLSVGQGGTGVSTSTGSGSNVLSNSPVLAGTPTTPTATAGTNTLQIASTAFVTNAVTSATGSLGTMSTQNANAVTITGGSISGVSASLSSALPTNSGGTGLVGSSSLITGGVLLGNGSSPMTVLNPNAIGDVMFSTNGSTWTNIQKIVRPSAQSLTGSAVTFSGIPSWVKRITVMFINMASSGTNYEIRLGTSGGIAATGYNSAGASAGNNSSGATYSTTGFMVRASAVSGQMIINNISGNIWTESYCARETATYADWGGGDVTLSGTVTQLSINSIGGTFSAGTVNIIYE